MRETTLETYLFFILLLGAFILAFFIVKPFLYALVLAVVFSVIFEPLYLKCKKFFNNRETLSAFVVLFLVLLIVLIPLFFFGIQLGQEAGNLYDFLVNEEGRQSVVDKVSESVGTLTERFFPSDSFTPSITNEDVRGYTLSFLAFVRDHIGVIFSSIAQFFVNLLLFLIAFFYLLKDGEKLRETVIAVSPFRDDRDGEIIKKLQGAINSVIKGSLFLGIIQGVLTGIGFLIFGVPSPALWGSVAAIMALVPAVGTSVVVGLGVLYLLFIGSSGPALGLLIWGLVVVGLSDNVLAPKLMSRGLKLHPLLILISVLGGIAFFGPFGFIFGPLAMSFLFALLEIYRTILVKEVKIS